MSFFQKLFSIFSESSKNVSGDAYWITAKCNRCGEIIRTRINLNNDLSAEYGDEGVTAYYCHKQLMGEGTGELRCFQRVDVELTFDANKRVTNREISGGRFVD